MIPGIEVLSQYSVSDAAPGIVFGFILFLLFMVFALSIILLISSIQDSHFGGMFAGVVFLLFGLFFLPFAVYKQVNPNIHTEYKVLISDEVSWNEFNERYEVINQEGKIYTIKEKAQ